MQKRKNKSEPGADKERIAAMEFDRPMAPERTP